MEKNYLLKIKSVLEDLNKCLFDRERTGFYDVISNIYSLMFNGYTLKPEISMILPNDISGYFTNMMWSINQTGAYFGDVINSYKVNEIIKCTNDIIKILDGEIFKEIQIDENDFYTNILTACSLMQSNYAYHDKKENGNVIRIKEDYRNYYLRDLFDFKGLYVRGQEHQGKSQNGKASGEVDLLVCRTEHQPKIFVEGMNLDSLDITKVEEHYEKLFLYDASINKNNYLLSYVNVSNFESFTDNYKKYFENYEGKTKCISIVDVASGYANIKVLLSKATFNGENINTYHILIFFEQY